MQNTENALPLSMVLKEHGVVQLAISSTLAGLMELGLVPASHLQQQQQQQ